ncbi:hypothetical protein PoB_003474100 [Plakobranchus ocellatus]|uniref:Recombinase domain-containing protein n=1 Tax=Plakobranchus ocellatus TaxID=259542 RepID=A0AAV4ANS5_9GAST|nr:hypothetical protein PoB_003474100 [Plakobranchus ocellatus]
MELFPSEVVNSTLLADDLQKTEGVRIVVQWLLSQAGVTRNEIANRIANQGRIQPQPWKPSTLSDVRSVLKRGTPELWSAAQLSNNE